MKEETLIDVELIKLKERQTNQLNCDLFEKCCKLQNENTELKQIISSTKNHLDLYKFGLEALKREIEEDLETEVLEGINTINKDFLEVINEAIAELKEYLRSD